MSPQELAVFWSRLPLTVALAPLPLVLQKMSSRGTGRSCVHHRDNSTQSQRSKADPFDARLAIKHPPGNWAHPSDRKPPALIFLFLSAGFRGHFPSPFPVVF